MGADENEPVHRPPCLADEPFYNIATNGCLKTYLFLRDAVYLSHCDPALIFLWITCPWLVSTVPTVNHDLLPK